MLGAAGPVIGLLLVQDAIDNGMKNGDTSRLTRDVIIYLAVNAAAWVLTSTMIRGLARVGQAVVLALREHLFEHLTALSLRYFSRAARRLDHRAPHLGRRRGLGRPLAGADDARRELADARRRGRSGCSSSTGGSGSSRSSSCRRRSS